LFFLYTTGAVLSLFVLLNFASLLFLNEKELKLQDYSKELHHVMNESAYYPPHPKINLEKSYMEENIADNIRYTYMSRSEFDYYPRLEVVHSSPYISRHINVIKGINDLPNRATLTLSYLPKKILYCFGGSTTFGTLISDEHTFSALLMKLYLDRGDSVLVKNYGVCGYNADQETLEFLELLRIGHRPSIAIFMDGVNVGPPFDGSECSLGLAERFAFDDTRNDYTKIMHRLPLLRWLAPDKSLEESSLIKKETFELILGADSFYNRKYANRIIENAALRKLIGAYYHVKVITFLQPNVFYDYDNQHFASKVFLKNVSQKYFDNYREIYRQVKASGQLFDLSGLFSVYGQPAVVDLLHYSPDFCRFLAEKVSGYYQLDSLKDYHFSEKEATGIPFDKGMFNN
jgi:hypothetical protein